MGEILGYSFTKFMLTIVAPMMAAVVALILALVGCGNETAGTSYVVIREFPDDPVEVCGFGLSSITCNGYVYDSSNPKDTVNNLDFSDALSTLGGMKAMFIAFGVISLVLAIVYVVLMAMFGLGNMDEPQGALAYVYIGIFTGLPVVLIIVFAIMLGMFDLSMEGHVETLAYFTSPRLSGRFIEINSSVGLLGGFSCAIAAIGAALSFYGIFMQIDKD